MKTFISIARTEFLKTNPDPRWRRLIRRLVTRYQYYYKVKVALRKQRITVHRELCRRSKATIRDRFAQIGERLHRQLPPTRYTVPGRDLSDIINRRTGTRGPYDCFTGARNDSSLYGFQTVPKHEGSATMFYDIAGEIERLLHPRNYFRMKIRAGSRAKLIASSRFMLTDLALCPRNPAHPGPASFYPLNYCLKV